MKGSEFIRKIKKLAKAKNISVRLDKKRGKGSHITLYFGDRVLMHLLFIGNQAALRADRRQDDWRANARAPQCIA